MTLFFGIMLYTNVARAADYWTVITKDADGNKVDATGTNVDGLTWDAQNCRLTLNGYNGNEIEVYKIIYYLGNFNKE